MTSHLRIAVSFLVGFLLAVTAGKFLVDGQWIAAYFFMLVIGAGFAADTWIYEKQSRLLNQAISDLNEASTELAAHMERMNAFDKQFEEWKRIHHANDA